MQNIMNIYIDLKKKDMVFKKLIISIIFIFITTQIFSYSFEEIKDIDKIRWIDCGEDILDFPEIEKIEFQFYKPQVVSYYKFYYIRDVDIRNVGDGGYTTIKKGEFWIECEYIKDYFILDFSESDILELRSKPESYFSTMQRYNTSSLFDDYIREDNKPNDIHDLCTSYVNTKYSDRKLIIEKNDNFDFDGFVKISDNNLMLNEEGRHFIKYDPLTNSFTADSLYLKKYGKLEGNGNDQFQIKIEKWSDAEKLLILDTPQYTRPYVPMEDFFTPNTSKVCIEKTYEEKNENIVIYGKPDFLSEPIKKLDGKKLFFGKIIETTANLEEHEGKISKWVKVKFNDGFEGWVWGRDVTLFDSPSGYDFQKVKRYVEYNTVK